MGIIVENSERIYIFVSYAVGFMVVFGSLAFVLLERKALKKLKVTL